MEILTFVFCMEPPRSSFQELHHKIVLLTKTKQESTRQNVPDRPIPIVLKSFTLEPFKILRDTFVLWLIIDNKLVKEFCEKGQN